MREIWNASKNPMQWRNEPTDHILRWWWFGWIIHNILANIHLEVVLAAHDVSSLSLRATRLAAYAACSGPGAAAIRKTET